MLMFAALLLAAPAPDDDSYRAIMDCLASTWAHDQANFRATGKLVNDDLWLNDLSQKSLAAKNREGIASSQYSADMAKAMDDHAPPPLDDAGLARCQAHFGYHLN